MNELNMRWLSMLAGGFAAFALTFAFVSLEPAPVRRVGLRSRMRSQVSASGSSVAAALRMVSWAARRCERFLPRRWLKGVDDFLMTAGDPVGLEPSEFIVASALLGTLGGTLGAVYCVATGRPLFMAFVIGTVLACVPYFRTSSVGAERLTQLQNALPPAVDLLALGLSAGLDFPGALRMITDRSQKKSEPLVIEFQVLLEELGLGKTRREVLEAFALRAPLLAVREFTGAVIQAEEEGTPLAKVLMVQANVSRQRRSARADELATRAGLQLLIPMALVFMAVMILIAAPAALQVVEGLK